MKLHILYKFSDHPFGGANQFLKGLRDEWRRTGHYTNDIHAADAVVANANPNNLPYLLRHLPAYKKRRPAGRVIVRLDGPISLIRGRDQAADELIKHCVEAFADGVIYQSQWSRQKNHDTAHITAAYETVIINAPDDRIFYPPRPRNKNASRVRIKLIASAWSTNSRKGFDIYRFLDQHLDWQRYEMSFIGNSPIVFNNIRSQRPLSSSRLAEELRRHDIYITASENDPCSNSLLEALACGLPAVARNSGGHPELLGKGGQLFDSPEECLTAIGSVADNLAEFKEQIPGYSLPNVAEQYRTFIAQTPPRSLKKSFRWHVFQMHWQYRARQIRKLIYDQ